MKATIQLADAQVYSPGNGDTVIIQTHRNSYRMDLQTSREMTDEEIGATIRLAIEGRNLMADDLQNRNMSLRDALENVGENK